MTSSLNQSCENITIITTEATTVNINFSYQKKNSERRLLNNSSTLCEQETEPADEIENKNNETEKMQMCQVAKGESIHNGENNDPNSSTPQVTNAVINSIQVNVEKYQKALHQNYRSDGEKDYPTQILPGIENTCDNFEKPVDKVNLAKKDPDSAQIFDQTVTCSDYAESPPENRTADILQSDNFSTKFSQNSNQALNSDPLSESKKLTQEIEPRQENTTTVTSELSINLEPTSSEIGTNSANLKVDMVKRKKKSESFVIDFGAPQKTVISPKKKLSSGNLQDSFQKFQQMKIDQLKQQKKLRKAQQKRKQKERAKPENMWNLRMRFLHELKKYMGVPYAKRYFKPGEPEYESKIFLDCCGLVRRALWNLQFLFGFRIGPWNQAYMFDTLPIDIKDEKDMKPGDLVFISGIYNEGIKFKNSPHNMKHIEVWLGKGQKTIGSRWQRGTVSIFDSYKFESKTYHDMQYHFKSIDTWLKGFCKSACVEHPWKLKSRPVMFSEKSVFAKKKLGKKKSIEKEPRNKNSAKPAEKQTANNKRAKSAIKMSRSKVDKPAKGTTQFRSKADLEDTKTLISQEFVTDFGDLDLEGDIEQAAEAAQQEELSAAHGAQSRGQINGDDAVGDDFDLEGAEDCFNDGMGDEESDSDQEELFDQDDEESNGLDDDDDDDEGFSYHDEDSSLFASSLEDPMHSNGELLTNPFDDFL